MTHYPVLLGLPNADIFTFDDEMVHVCDYEETDSYRITEMFINNREQLLKGVVALRHNLFFSLRHSTRKQLYLPNFINEKNYDIIKQYLTKTAVFYTMWTDISPLKW